MSANTKRLRMWPGVSLFAVIIAGLAAAVVTESLLSGERDTVETASPSPFVQGPPDPAGGNAKIHGTDETKARYRYTGPSQSEDELRVSEGLEDYREDSCI